MKTMMAQDSERLCVLDGSEKNSQWMKFIFAPIGYFVLFALTVYGGAVGLENKEKIDMWTSAPQNQITILIITLAIVSIPGLILAYNMIKKIF